MKVNSTMFTVQYNMELLKRYPSKILHLLAGKPPHLTLHQVSCHFTESTKTIA